LGVFAAPNVMPVNVPFWRVPTSLWDTLHRVGLRSHFVASQFAVPLMLPQKRGLIVNTSSGGGVRYTFNVPFGVQKSGVDRMARDMAHELKPFGITGVRPRPSVRALSWNIGHGIENLMTKQIQSIVVAACVARLLPLGMVLLIGMQTAQAKQCSAAVPPDPQGHWSYRFIDGRKCWYQGENMLSKSLLHWPEEEASALSPSGKELPLPDKEPTGGQRFCSCSRLISRPPGVWGAFRHLALRSNRQRSL
jgi:hypothetical protein